MKIQDLIQKIQTDDNVNLQNILEIRTYIPIAEKKVILETVLDTCLAVKDGVVLCDYVLKETAFELAMVKYHTDLDVDITSEDDYDALQQLHMRDIVLHDEYGADYKMCRVLFEGMEKERRSQYSLEASLTQLSNTISEHITKLVSQISEKVDGFDLSKMGLGDIKPEQLQALLNKYGK